MGVGLAAMRDVIAFFRNARQDSDGWQNPLAGQVHDAIGVGASQAGNLIRTFLNLGFNEDEAGRRVLDGALPSIAARQTPVNVRFAIPGGASSPYELGSEGVVWWADWPDAVRGHATSGLLHRCTLTHTCPKIIEVLGSSEFWSLRASPDFVGTDNRRDIPLPENVRRYYIASTQHGGGAGGFHAGPMAATAPRAAASSPGAAHNPIQGMPCMLPLNPNPEEEIREALLADLKAWVLKGTPPPPSNYPRLADGTLVPANSHAMNFPFIPGAPVPDGVANPLLVYDLGKDFDYNDLSGVVAGQPPTITDVIPPLAPKVDSDGNEVGGIHTVQQQAALGTYLGWNVTAEGFQKGQYCSLWGSYIPFAVTKAGRVAVHDPRLSLEERYGTQEGFVCVVRKAAESLVQQRLLLKQDADRMVAQAAASAVLPPASSASQQDQATERLRCAP